MDDFKDLTCQLGVDDDCPVCAYSWPACQGMCVAHESMNGRPGPFHTDFNDDCEQCKDAQHGSVVLTKDGLSPTWTFTCGCVGIPLYKPSDTVSARCV